MDQKFIAALEANIVNLTDSLCMHNLGSETGNAYIRNLNTLANVHQAASAASVARDVHAVAQALTDVLNSKASGLIGSMLTTILTVADTALKEEAAKQGQTTKPLSEMTGAEVAATLDRIIRSKI